MAHRDDTPAFARSGESDPRGKLDERIDIPVPAELKEDAAFVARASGMTLSEWGRSILVRELYGSVKHIQTIVQRHNVGDGTKGG